MYVNVEFLGDEPLENVITGMHFRMDKTIYFGYPDMLEKHKFNTDKFLRKNCGVESTEFHALSRWDLQSVLEQMRSVLQAEYDAGNKVFFDITGGESLVLVAFGILSKEFETPMHMYDVVRDKLIELDEGAEASISRMVPRQTVKMDLDKLVQLRGGVINYSRHKDIKNIADENFAMEVKKLWQIVARYGLDWNAFSDFIKEHCQPKNSLSFAAKSDLIEKALKENKNKRMQDEKKFYEMLHACEKVGAILDLERRNGWYRFRYKNETIKGWLCDPGTILELYVYLQEREHADDCRIGINLDWDGVIHQKSNDDVFNELDVLVLHGNIPTFISCKNGNVDKMSLYELGIIAEQFGGKYAKLVIAAPQGLYGSHALRAEEMQIEVMKFES